MAVPPSSGAPDGRWKTVAVIMGAFICFGFVLHWRFLSPEMSFSAQISWGYVPMGILMILVLGWNRFDLAAAIFFGYQGLGQATNATYFLVGDIQAAMTMEELLAIPLVFMGLFGPSAKHLVPSRPQSRFMLVSLTLVLVSAGLSTAFAVSPQIALATLFARFILPSLIMVGIARRCKDVSDYKVIWFGFVLGMLAIAVFDFRRIVLGEGAIVGTYKVDQRYAGAGQSFAIPTLYIIGGALWLGYAIAEAGRVFRGALWLLLAVGIGMLMWLGGARGPVLGLGMLVVWWIPRRFVRSFANPRLIGLAIVAVFATCIFVGYSMGRTAFDVGLTGKRMAALFESGLARSNRWGIWMEGLRYWGESPLFGQGLNSWVTFNRGWTNVHGGFVGILLDTGVMGMACFTLLIVATLRLTGKRNLVYLSEQDRRFFLGCRAGWCVMMFILMFNLPFTSGQPLNNIFSYMVFFFPALVMVVHSRQAPSFQPVGGVSWPTGVSR